MKKLVGYIATGLGLVVATVGVILGWVLVVPLVALLGMLARAACDGFIAGWATSYWKAKK